MHVPRLYGNGPQQRGAKVKGNAVHTGTEVEQRPGMSTTQAHRQDKMRCGEEKAERKSGKLHTRPSHKRH